MSNRLRYPEFAPAGIATMRATEHYLNATTALSPVLLELVRLRVSLRNGCPFCIGHHETELRKHNEPETRIAAVVEGAASDAFTAREQAALTWADSVTDIGTRHANDEDYAAVSAFFHEKDLVDLTMAIASINAWNRMSIAFGAEWDPAKATPKSRVPSTSTSGLSPTDDSDSPPPPAGLKTGNVPLASAIPSSGTVPTHEDAPVQDAVDDDGGKVAHD